MPENGFENSLANRSRNIPHPAFGHPRGTGLSLFRKIQLTPVKPPMARALSSFAKPAHDMNANLGSATIPNLEAVKASHKAMWESADFGHIARTLENVAEEFMARQPLQPGSRVLDVACGTGNLAVIAARRGCVVSGVDIASNLIEQARARAVAEGLRIDFDEGDAEALPFAGCKFDLVVSMYGVMFAPRPDVAAAELERVTKSGGRVALANWTPDPPADELG